VHTDGRHRPIAPIAPCNWKSTTAPPARSLRSGAVGERSVWADELLALLAERRMSGVRGRSLSLSWRDVRTRSLEMLYGLRASHVEPGGSVAFPGRLRAERLCAELGTLAGGFRIADGDADVVVVDDASDARAAADNEGLVVVIDGTQAGRAIGLDRFAARGVAWAASHLASPLPVPLPAAPGILAGDHVLLRAVCGAGVARSVLVGGAVAGTDLYVGEPGVDALVELERTGAEVLATDVDEAGRIADVAANQRTTGVRALRRLGRGPLGGRLRLVLVDRVPGDEACAALARIGVEVATAS
jgi:hypothetical protein